MKTMSSVVNAWSDLVVLPALACGVPKRPDICPSLLHTVTVHNTDNRSRLRRESFRTCRDASKLPGNVKRDPAALKGKRASDAAP
jgi:hypothetical protein